MQKMIALLVAMALIVSLAAGCVYAPPPDTTPTTGPSAELTTEPTSEPTTEPTAEPTTESTEPVVDLLAWRTPEWEDLSYEAFFAQNRSHALWRGFSGKYRGDYYTTWEVPDATEEDGSQWYSLILNEGGFCIHEGQGGDKPALYSVPDTADLYGCPQFVADGHNAYVVVNGTELVCVDLVSGQRKTIYSAPEILGTPVITAEGVLYFLSESGAILNLNRLYLPTMTLDLLYAQYSGDIPGKLYTLQVPDSTEGEITWHTMNPAFWELWQQIDADPESPYKQVGFGAKPGVWEREYVEQNGFEGGFVMNLCNELEKKENLRSRMKVTLDMGDQIVSVEYGIYDNCYFGSANLNEHSHFAPYQTYEPET